MRSITLATALIVSVFLACDVRAGALGADATPFRLATSLTGTSAKPLESVLQSSLGKSKKKSRKNNRRRGGRGRGTFQPNGGRTIHGAPTLSKADQEKAKNNPLDYLKGKGLSKQSPLSHRWPTKKGGGSKKSGKK